MNNRNKKTLIFDFDGTIADSFEVIVKEAGGLVPGFDLTKITPVELEFYKEKTLRELLKMFGVSYLRLLFYIGKARKKVNQNFIQVLPFNGMNDVLKKAKDSGFDLFILSWNQKQIIKRFLKDHGLEYFDKIYPIPGLLGKNLVFNLIMVVNGLTRDSIYYIGDEVRDIEGCKKCGLKCISVTWGFNSKKVLEAYNPDYLVNSPAELLSLLDRI